MRRDLHLASGSQRDHQPQPSPLQGHPAGASALESSDLLSRVTFATGPVSFALSAFSNAALTGLGFLKLCLSKDLWSKQGLVCPGRVLDPETVLALCFREVALPAPSASPSDPVGPGALPCPVASTHQGTGRACPAPAPPSSLGVRRARLCTSNATSRPLPPTLAAPCVCACSVYLWCAPPTEGYLLFNLFVEVLPGSPAPPGPPGVGSRKLCVGPQSCPVCVCGGWTCTGANLRGVGDGHFGVLCPEGWVLNY